MSPAAGAQVSFTRLTAEDGLGNNSVQCILQDKSGIVWIGTNGGLNRYDGATFIQYSILSKPALVGNVVTALLEDVQGNIWIGTEDGLSILDPLANTVRQFTHAGIAPGPIRGLQKLRDGSICILSESWIYTFTSQQGFRRMRLDPALLGPTKVFTALSQTQDNRLWISYLDQPAAQAIVYADSLGATGLYWPGCSRACPDTAQRLWGVSYFGVTRYDGRTGRFEHWLKNNSAQKIPDLHLYTCYSTDAEGNIWVGSRQLNLVKYDLRHKQVIDYNGLLTACNVTIVYCIYKDRSDMLWIGTDNGIIKLSGHSFFFTPLACMLQGREQKDIRCRKIVADSSGVLYAGTESHGLLRLTNPSGGRYAMEQLSVFGAYPVSALPQHGNSIVVPLNGHYDIGYVYDMWYDGGTTLWLTGYGLGRYDTRSARVELFLAGGGQKERTESITQFCICPDDSLFWLGGQHNLFVFRRASHRMEPFRDEKGEMPFHDIPCWSLAKKGRYIWAGTEKGLYRIDRLTKTVTRESDYPALGLSINAIYTDKDSSFWISTAGGGVVHYNSTTHALRQYTTREGLSNNMVCGILPDDAGNLWISTYSGLNCLNPVTGSFTGFYAKDGLNMNEFNRKAFARLPDGRLVFGGLNGYLLFDPREILRSDKPASILLTHLGRSAGDGFITDSVFGIQTLRSITIGPENPFFSLTYTLSDMYDPARNRYFYKIQGLDKEWHAIGNQHTLSFMSLPAGRYTLQIKGTPAWGREAANTIAVEIIVQQVLYRRPWFLALGVLAAAAIILAIVQYRLYQWRKLHQLRTRIASDLHDEVGGNLVRITLLADADKNGTTVWTATERLDVIAGISRDAASTIRDVVWSIDARNDTMAGMLEHMHDHLHQMLAPAGIEYLFSPSNAHPEEKLRMEFRQNIYRIFREAINNIVKHSDATLVEVRVSADAHLFSLTIKDNGRGMKGKKAGQAGGNGGQVGAGSGKAGASGGQGSGGEVQGQNAGGQWQSGSGQGLSNMQLRADRLAGKLEIISGDDGVTIALTTPI